MDWSKLSPDHVIYALTFIGTVGGWLWRKARGESNASFRETINHAIDSIVFEMFDEVRDDDVLTLNVQGYLASIRARVEKHIWSVLSKRGVPRTKTTERLVHEAIERASNMVAREVVSRRAAARRDRGGS